MPAQAPNIVLITVDCLRADAVGSAGGSAYTPQIDRLSATGVNFQRAFAHGHFTKTTMAALFSGAYPWQYGGSRRFTAERPSLPAALQSHGYHTLGVNSNPWLSARYGYPRGFGRYVDLSEDRPLAHRLPVRALNHLLGLVGGGLIIPAYPSGQRVTKAALELLATSRPPFFLWLHYMDAHWPYHLSAPKVFGPWDKQNWVYNARLADRSRKTPDRVSDRERRTLRSKYDHAVAYIDQQIGRLLAHLGEETCVILTADHGEAFGEHGRYFHQPALHAENVHIPLIMRTSSLPGGRSIPEPVRQIDIAPTVLGLTNVPAQDGFEGINLLPFVNSQSMPSDLAALGLIDITSKNQRWISLRQRGWAAMARCQGDPVTILQSLLYNYIEDPSEKIDLSNQHPERLDKMLAHAQGLLKTSGAVDDHGIEDDVDLDADMIERLKSLGYLE